MLTHQRNQIIRAIDIMAKKEGSPEKVVKIATQKGYVIKPNKFGNPSGNKHRIKG
jgi:hypothetical protein